MTSLFNTDNLGKANAKLPFSVDNISFISWMSDLNRENKVETLKILSKTLTTLRHEELKPEDRIFFLQKLSELVEQLSQQLQETYKHSRFPFSEQNFNNLKLSVSCAAEVAKNYAILCEDKGFVDNNVFTKQQKALVIYNAIQSLARAFLYQSLLYQKPESGFWNLCFLFYLFAKQNNVLDVELDFHYSCFIGVFKQILLFELSNTRQFNTEELFSVFHFLNKVSDRAELLNKVPDKKIRDIPCINLRVDAPPSLLKEGAKPEDPYQFYISSLHVIKQSLELLADKNTLKICNKQVLLRLIKTLTMKYQRASDREATDERLFACIGFDKVKKYVLESKQGKEGVSPGEIRDLEFGIQEIDTELGKSHFFRAERAADLSLLTDSVILEDIKSSDIWGDEKEKVEHEPKKPVTNTELVDKSSTGFRLRLNTLATKVGDIIAVTMFDTLVVTVVRRIVKLQGNSLQVGVEVLGDNPEVLHLSDINNKKVVTAIYLKGDDDMESIIIGTNDYKNEEYVIFDNKARFRGKNSSICLQ